MKTGIFVMTIFLVLTQPARSQDHAHDDDHSQALELSEEQQQMLELEVITLRPDPEIKQSLTVPAEITSNQYRTWVVPVPIDSRVLSRTVTLGQHLAQDDTVATLFSPEMAELQSDLQVAADEWRRVRDLGRPAVGNQRYLDVQSRYQSLRARALGYGLNDAELDAIETGDAETGIYTLRAPDDGLVLVDSFQQGQWLSAGDDLITLVDESELWAEAALPPLPGFNVDIGTRARVSVADTVVIGEVIQAGHRLDPVTRTLQLRLSVPNQDHLLHPGMFAEVSLELPLPAGALTLPAEALSRGADGDWQAFVQEAPGHYRPREVSVSAELQGRYIIEGLPPGTKVVTNGAFFLAGELAKAGFDVHAH